MRKALVPFIAIVLSVLFTVGLIYATIEIPTVITNYFWGSFQTTGGRLLMRLKA